jgi:hypothetical protein
MKRNRWNPRKVLIASAGLASVNYAVAAGCNGNEPLVANLVACPPAQCPPSGTGGASVANLVAPPPGGNGSGAFGGASVANLVAPPPPVKNMPPDVADIPDADILDAAPDAVDAAPDGSN